MKLFYSAASPFVRKCLVLPMSSACASESSSCPPPRTRSIATARSLRTIRSARYHADPRRGAALYDSRVICEYLNAAANGKLIPQSGPAR